MTTAPGLAAAVRDWATRARETRARAAQARLWPRLYRILGLARPQRARIAGALAAILVAAGFSLLFPLGIRSLLDTAIEGGRSGLLHLLAGALFGIFLIRAALVYVGHYVLQLAGERMVIDLRRRLFSHLHTLDQRYFGEQRIGDLTSRLTSDAAAIRNAVTEIAVSTLHQLFQLAGALAIMLWLNGRLTLLVLLVAPATTVISRGFAPRLRRYARQVQTQTGGAIAVAQESLSAVHVVRAFARAPYETRRFADALHALFATFRKSVRVNALFRALIGLVTAGASVAIFWIGGLEVLSGRLSAGDLIAFLFYSQTIAGALGSLAQMYGDLSYAAGASDRVFEVLDTRPSVVEAPDAVRLPEVRGAVSLQYVWFGYEPDRPVLRGIDLETRPGETLALVGPSGAGKTTLLHLLARFFDPTAGRVLLDGRDLRTLELDWLREQIALVAQDVVLFGTTVRDNIRYGRLDAGDEEIEAAASAANAHRFIRELPDGYDTEIGERGVRLSGGQRQRIALARAFLKDAKILMLDEATSAIDSASEQRIREAMDRLRRDRTTFLVAHRLASVVASDRILVLDQGRIVEAGTHDELLATDGVYRRLLRAQHLENPTQEGFASWPLLSDPAGERSAATPGFS